MSIKCSSLETGKINASHFINKTPDIIAAGERTKWTGENVRNNLQYYLLKDKVDALINDTIVPPPILSTKLPALVRVKSEDYRNKYPTEVAKLLQDAPLTNFRTVAENLKNTVYSSYWNKPLASSKDPGPMLPIGMDIKNTTFGKKLPKSESLYELVFPKCPIYNNESYQETKSQKPNVIFGHKYKFDVKSSNNMKDCLTDINFKKGNANSDFLLTTQADAKAKNRSQVGKVLGLEESIPEKHTNEIKQGNCYAGNYVCEINPKIEIYKRGIAYLNYFRISVRKQHSKSFFKKIYSEIIYLDKNHTGWIKKQDFYNYLLSKTITINPILIEPLLVLWNIYDGINHIDYKKFIDIINFSIPLPSLPKLEDFPKNCLNFKTTYSEMSKPDQVADSRPMAGLPSGRYIDLDYTITPDGCCKAYQTCLLQESDVRSCLSPSTMTQYPVTHRDMYAKRDPNVVRDVFEAAGESFTDETFDQLWQEAQKYHSKRWVCFETFRRVLRNKVRNSF